MVTQFKLYLAKTNLAENTIASYVWTVTYFLEHYKEVNKKNLLAYKGYLVENFKPQTVNLRLQAVNRFLEFNKQEKQSVKPMPCPASVVARFQTFFVSDCSVDILFAIFCYAVFLNTTKSYNESNASSAFFMPPKAAIICAACVLSSSRMSRIVQAPLAAI